MGNVSGNPDVASGSTPIVTSSGELLDFAGDTNNELFSFYRTTGGEWEVFDVTAYVNENP